MSAHSKTENRHTTEPAPKPKRAEAGRSGLQASKVSPCTAPTTTGPPSAPPPRLTGSALQVAHSRPHLPRNRTCNCDCTRACSAPPPSLARPGSPAPPACVPHLRPVPTCGAATPNTTASRKRCTRIATQTRGPHARTPARRRAARGTRHAARGTRHAARGTRHAARGTRHAARGTRQSATHYYTGSQRLRERTPQPINGKSDAAAPSFAGNPRPPHALPLYPGEERPRSVTAYVSRPAPAETQPRPNPKPQRSQIQNQLTDVATKPQEPSQAEPYPPSNSAVSSAGTAPATRSAPSGPGRRGRAPEGRNGTRRRRRTVQSCRRPRREYPPDRLPSVLPPPAR